MYLVLYVALLQTQQRKTTFVFYCHKVRWLQTHVTSMTHDVFHVISRHVSSSWQDIDGDRLTNAVDDTRPITLVDKSRSVILIHINDCKWPWKIRNTSGVISLLWCWIDPSGSKSVRSNWKNILEWLHPIKFQYRSSVPGSQETRSSSVLLAI